MQVYPTRSIVLHCDLQRTDKQRKTHFTGLTHRPRKGFGSIDSVITPGQASPEPLVAACVTLI
jgi:hypothetical protein